MIYNENNFTELTGIVEENGGAVCFIRQSYKEKIAKPTICPKTNCPDSFSIALGKQFYLVLV